MPELACLRWREPRKSRGLTPRPPSHRRQASGLCLQEDFAPFVEDDESFGTYIARMKKVGRLLRLRRILPWCVAAAHSWLSIPQPSSQVASQ